MKRRARTPASDVSSPKTERQRYEELLWIAEHGDVPSIDLHGLSTLAALHELEDFIHTQIYRRTPVVAIIHGHGTGALRSMALKWLKEHPELVPYHRPSLTARYSGVVLAVLGN